ncbi:MAG TPA: hypothetical protein VMS71_02790, partial [Candidatus Acidoferrum sp.]|nr:hypothetical protein [Candidatus Acidoferrum sp.]
SNNICVAGTGMFPTSGLDYVTIKYYPNGDTAWVRKYNSGGTQDDHGVAVGVDGSGNVYVTGYSYIGAHGLDNVITTRKYSPAGTLLWSAAYGPAGELKAGPRDIFVDAVGNAYVAGASDRGVATGFDAIVIKYLPSGDTAWVRRYAGPRDIDDMLNAITVDDFGNVYAAGSTGYLTNSSYLTLAYDALGNLLWSRAYQGVPPPEFGDNIADGIDHDGKGNIFVFGTVGSTPYSKTALIKYLAGGDMAWVRWYPGPGGPPYAMSALHSVRVDKNGWVYAGASKQVAAVGPYDYTTLRYDQSGDTTWVRLYDGGGDDRLTGLAPDIYGNICVTGRSYLPAGGWDWITIKYDRYGDEMWRHKYSGPGPVEYDDDVPNAIATDNFGYVCVTGYSSNLTVSQDITTIKYYPDCCQGATGNVDGDPDDVVDISDLSAMVDFLFSGGSLSSCAAENNVDGLGSVDISDLQMLIDFLFSGAILPSCPV